MLKFLINIQVKVQGRWQREPYTSALNKYFLLNRIQTHTTRVLRGVHVGHEKAQSPGSGTQTTAHRIFPAWRPGRDPRRCACAVRWHRPPMRPPGGGGAPSPVTLYRCWSNKYINTQTEGSSAGLNPSKPTDAYLVTP